VTRRQAAPRLERQRCPSGGRDSIGVIDPPTALLVCATAAGTAWLSYSLGLEHALTSRHAVAQTPLPLFILQLSTDADVSGPGVARCRRGTFRRYGG
jgi:hypothetical protein